MKKFLILGYGYTGPHLEKHISALIPDSEIKKTNRQKDLNLYFDLSEPESWENIPKVDGTFWTFPPIKERLVTQFLEKQGANLGKIVVIGSTRSIQIQKEHEEVDENSPLDLTIDRVRGEKLIRDQGGILVQSAGIYGPGRNPIDWIRKGWVAPCKKLLNVIHVVDLAKILLAAMQNGEPGKTYLAADGRPYPWDELISRWVRQYELTQVPKPNPSMRKSKKVNPEHTLSELKIELSYPDVYAGVSEIEL